MKKLLLIFLICLPFCISAQSLVKSRRTSYYTYIFRLNDTQAKTIYRKDLYVADQTYFHTTVDSFPTGTAYEKPLPFGHYLVTYADGGELVYELKSVNNLSLQLLNNKVDLVILATDSTGKAVTDANIQIRQMNVPFNKKAGAYLLKKARRKGLVTVTYQGFTSYHQISTDNNQPFMRKVKNRIIYTRPVYWIWKPFKDIVITIKYGYPDGWIRKAANLFDPGEYRDHQSKYRGYMAFNKPKYLPGDTVKLKAFVLTKHGKPIKHDLMVQLHTPTGRKTLATLQPYRKGGYHYEFVISDSMQLQMDKNYGIWLEKKKYKPVMYGSFNVEEYELATNTFSIRSEKPVHNTGTTAVLFAQGKDENELNVTDATLELTVLSGGIKNFREKYLFVKDTLWHHQQALDPVGETKIVLPDSIFPASSIDYTVHAVFLNASNERHTQTLHLQYIHTRKEVNLSLEKDTLMISYAVSGKIQPAAARLTSWMTGQEKPSVRSVQLPFKEALNPFVYHYSCQVDSTIQVYDPAQENDLFECYSHRTNDSLFIWVENPRKLPFYYTIYRKNQVIHRGSGKALNFADKATTPGNYFISVQYVWNGRMQEKEYQIPFQKNKLNISIHQPMVVSPGQKANIDITVTDSKGAPASNVDITAYAITKKFKDAYVPEVPYLGKTYKSRKSLNRFKLNQNFNNRPATERHLNWEFWNPEMGLDSIAYYKFLYPDTGLFTQYISTPDSLSQFAPYVVQDGALLHAYLIYLDGRPVYYKDTDVAQRYSFTSYSGYHSIKIRTSHKIITIDSVWLKPQSKLVLSIDAGNPHKLVQVQNVKMEYNPQEQQLLNRYVMHVKPGLNYADAYLRQGNFIQPFITGKTSPYFYKNTWITGVFMPTPMQFVLKDAYTASFIFEPLYTYEFREQLLKMRSINPENFYTYRLNYDASKLRPDFTAHPYTIKEIDSLRAWQQEIKMASIRKFSHASTTTNGFGKLVIHQIQLPDSAEKRIKQVLLFRQDDPDFLQVYPGNATTFHQLKPGVYKVVLLLYFNYYIETDYITVQPNGRNNITISDLPLHAPDDFSRKAADMIQKEAYTLQEEKKDLQEVKESYYNTYNISPSGNFTHLVTGFVTDAADGSTLPGVNVLVKGTTIGTVTDIDGRYQLYVPLNGVLVFSFIGYMTEESLIGSRSVIDANMQADIKSLSEVVVVGYSEQRRQSLAASISTTSAIQGRVAGVQMMAKIRGISSIDGKNAPLIILDGEFFNGNVADIDPQLLASIEILKSDAATALYGSKGANGVILISTRKKPDSVDNFLQVSGKNIPQANSLRNRFSDYAYWQPRLTTNAAGKATFTATFPDDVTSWRTFVLAIDGKKRSGSAEASVKSFKSVVSNLSVPRFLVEGDSTWVIGKTTNYTSDTLTVLTRFHLNGKATNTRSTELIHSVIDSLQITTAGSDSLQLSYASTKPGAIEDGELRYIPVLPKGIQETKGIFLNLDTDTTLTLNFDPAFGKVSLFVQGDMLQVLLDEMQHIRRYEYACNEQAASKLIALLLEKKVRTIIGESFNVEREIQLLIRRLEAAQRKEGAWGWWPDSPPVIWISLHVAEALALAEKSGYPVRFGKQALQDYLIFEMENYQTSDKLRCLQLLKILNSKADYNRYIETLSKDTTLPLQQQLQLIEIRQQTGLSYNLDSLDKNKNTTLLGALYVGKEGYHLTDNAITNTLIAYRILKAKGGHEADLQSMRRYFLEKRSSGYWRNTYESALILSTILPDVLTDGKLKPSALSLQGALQTSVTTFPYQVNFLPGQPLTITKESKQPVYVTAYQQYWNTDPDQSEKDFVVQTHMEGRKGHDLTLKAGKPVKLIVEVEVKQDADYVLLEVPIPAGCSYENKRQSYRVEVHREYDTHKTSIFCQQLKKGKYEFTINLLPRYNGSYILNPAKAQLMYFPAFYGRNEIKKVKVE